MNYEVMSDYEVNLNVSKILGLKQAPVCPNGNGNTGMIIYPHSNEINFDPCNNPNDAWEIILKNRIATIPTVDNKWLAYGWRKWSGKVDYSPRKESTHTNKLRAAMIVFLMMKDAEK